MSSTSRRNIYITVALFVALSYFDSMNIRLLLAFTITVHMLWESWLQNKKLKRVQFNPEFMRSMARTSLLSYVGIIMVLAEFVITANA